MKNPIKNNMVDYPRLVTNQNLLTNNDETIVYIYLQTHIYIYMMRMIILFKY